MTINYLDSKRLQGLSADTKPTNVQTNSIFEQTDTNTRHWYNGTNWIRPPTDISGLKAWYDASDASTITKSSNLVSQWNDKSGQTNNLVQATGANQPLWVDAVQNGKPVIRFDGSDPNRMKVSTFSGGNETQPNTVFVVANAGTGSGDYVFDSATGDRAGFYSTGSPVVYNLYAGNEVSTGFSASTTVKLYTIIFNGASSFVRQNGTAGSNVNASTGAINGLVLGNYQGEVLANSLTGDICEFLFYGANITGTDLTDIEYYLTTKWGL